MRRLFSLVVVTVIALPVWLYATPPKIEVSGQKDPPLVFESQAAQDQAMKSLRDQIGLAHKALKASDTDGLVKLMTQDCIMLTPTQRLIAGRDEISKAKDLLLVEANAKQPAAISCEIAQVRFLNPTTGLEIGSFEAKGEKQVTGTYTQIWQRTGDHWLIASSSINPSNQNGNGRGSENSGGK